MPKKTKPAKKANRAKRPAAKKAARKVSPIPQHLTAITPQLTLRECARAIDFYKQAFGATELSRALAPDGASVWHAHLKIGNATFFLNDPMPGQPYSQPNGQIWLYGTDVDGRFDRAIKAGAKATMPVADMFWGDRTGTVVDPFGVSWNLATHIKDMSVEEMKRAGEEFAKQMAAQAGAQMPSGQQQQPQASA